MKIFFTILTALFLLLPGALPAMAQTQSDTAVQLTNPIGGTSDNPEGTTNINIIIGTAIQQTLTIIGSVVFAIVIYGGFLMLTSAGKEDQVRKGVKTIAYAAAGLFIIFTSYIVLDAIITAITTGG